MEYLNVINYGESIRAVFLLFIILTANFFASSLNCGIQYNLTTSPLFRHIFIYLFIVFSIEFTSKDARNVQEILLKSFVIFVFYIMFNKQHRYTMYVILMLFIALYMIYLQTNYLKKHKKNTKIYDDLTNKILLLITVITIIGFLMYVNKQQNDYKGKFDILRFIFGNNKCESLKKL